MFQKSLQLAPAIIVARLDERGKEAGTLHSEYSKASNKACFRKQGATLANFIPCYQKIFAPKKFLIKIHADFCRWQGTFCLVLHFPSLVATIRMHYRSLECCNTSLIVQS